MNRLTYTSNIREVKKLVKEQIDRGDIAGLFIGMHIALCSVDKTHYPWFFHSWAAIFSEIAGELIAENN